MTEAGSPLQTTQNIILSFSAYDQYAFQVVSNMVDDVCLYHARLDLVRTKYIT